MQQPEWKGSQPQRFSGGRRHMRPQDQFGNSLQLRNNNPSPRGIKTFSPTPTQEQSFKPIVRIYEERYNEMPKQIDLRGIKPVHLPEQKQRIRPERLHVDGGRETEREIDLRGIKSYDEANRSRDKHFIVEDQMQRKVRFYGLQSLRNDLTVTSLGDKSYKYPEYAPDFYKDGGLIAGSTQKPRPSQVFTEIKKGSILTRPNWDQRVKMQEVMQDQKVLDSIDNWQQTILKENNPNWNDPDTFFQRMEAGSKQVKKGGKK